MRLIIGTLLLVGSLVVGLVPMFQPVDVTASALPFDGSTLLAILMVIVGVILLVTAPVADEHDRNRN